MQLRRFIIIASCAFLFCTMPLWAQSEGKMVVHLRSGQTVTYEVGEVDSVQVISPRGTEATLTNELPAIDLGLSVLWAGANCRSDNEGTTSFFSFEEALQVVQSDAEGWRLPTQEEWQELYERCSWNWTLHDGQCGRRVTGPSGASIFLPAAGFMLAQQRVMADCVGAYWSQDVTVSPLTALSAYFDSANIFAIEFPRANGMAMRLVRDKGASSDQPTRCWLCVELQSGVRHTYNVRELLTLSFGGDSLLVAGPSLSVSYPEALVKSYRFAEGDDAANAIDMPSDDAGLHIHYQQAGLIELTGASGNATIQVYATNGQQVAVSISNEGGRCLIDLRQLPAGVYIITTQGLPPLKVVNR